MASKYFTLPSFPGTKKAQQVPEQIEAKESRADDETETMNSQEPVLNEEDEKWLTRHMSTDGTSDLGQEVEASKIKDDGQEQVATSGEVGNEAKQLVVPETQPANRDDGPKGDAKEHRPALPERKPKKQKSMDLPSQEAAEAATKGFTTTDTSDRPANADQKQTWSSYLPSIPSLPSPPQTSSGPDGQQQDRTWTQYASTYIPTSLTTSRRPTTPAQPPTEEEQSRELSSLLSNLNASSINNRVFAISAETAKLHSRFAQVLKDTINGGPTAYEDMDALMREAGPRLESQFKSLPPFVQTLVMSLPAKIGGTLGPEMVAAATKRSPEEDLKAASQLSSRTQSEIEPTDTTSEKGKKEKSRIPGLKSLISSQGAVATMLRNVVVFLQTRFPFIVSGTNVVMSLAVFILMFVFYYCHKRGREVRLAHEGIDDDEDSEAAEGRDEAVEDDGHADVKKADGTVEGNSLDQKQPVQLSNPTETEQAISEKGQGKQSERQEDAEAEARMRKQVDDMAETLASKTSESDPVTQ